MIVIGIAQALYVLSKKGQDWVAEEYNRASEAIIEKALKGDLPKEVIKSIFPKSYLSEEESRRES